MDNLCEGLFNILGGVSSEAPPFFFSEIVLSNDRFCVIMSKEQRKGIVTGFSNVEY